MTDGHVRDQLTAYALDALEAEERRVVAEHLRICPECGEDLAELRAVTDAMATSVPPASPPAALRRAVLEAARPDRPMPRQRWRPSWMALAAAAGVVVLVGALASVNQRLQALQSRLAAQEQALALLTAPAARTVELTGSVPASVRFVFDPARQEGALIVTDLRDLDRDLVYQLWLVAGTQPESAGVFRPEQDRPVIVPVSADFRRYQAVAISVERAPLGASRPTAAPILAAQF